METLHISILLRISLINASILYFLILWHKVRGTYFMELGHRSATPRVSLHGSNNP